MIVTTALLLYVRVNWVIPLPFPPLSLGLTEIETPLFGFDEATVRMRGGWGALFTATFTPPGYGLSSVSLE